MASLPPKTPTRRIPKKISVPTSEIVIKMCNLCGEKRDPEVSSAFCKNCREQMNKKGSIKRKINFVEMSTKPQRSLCLKCHECPRYNDLDYCEWCYDEWVCSRLTTNEVYFTNTGTYFQSRGETFFQDKETGSVIRRKLVFPVKIKPPPAPRLTSLNVSELAKVEDLLAGFEI